MKKWIILGLIIGLFSVVNSEAQMKKRVKSTAKESTTRKAEKTVDQSINAAADGLINGVKGAFKKKDKKVAKKGSKVEQPSSPTQSEESPSQKNSLDRYAKFSFIQGEEIIVYDDFSQDQLGDLPAAWISTGSAEIVSFEGLEGNWVWFNKTSGNFVPTYLDNFPENFTLEFDLMYEFEFDQYSFSRSLMLVFTDIANPESKLDWNGGGDYFNLQKLSANYFGLLFNAASANGGPYITGRKAVSANRSLNFSTDFKANKYINKDLVTEPLHISIARMGRRVQVFVNEEKVLDLTNAFEKEVKLTSARFFVNNYTEQDNYYLSNIRLAVGKPDPRSKLLDAGTFTTSAITFRSGSAEIQPESYGILKEIAAALAQEPTRKVQIIGHTDSDGSDQLNMKLSKERALAVMAALKETFNTQNPMEVDGKGEAEPLADNNSAAGKANNRRVEFILK
ncbi:OmpA family protein [Penaeicola halotolerans]|uniref:OmpA family protein n=1 Tax=Penaeicola halotolerans TaxID=2793196 RepID=UPI001CF84E4A|nr:OmpA family protein [Penaeicola halotolerans]